MPTLITQGAASARAFGLTSGSYLYGTVALSIGSGGSGGTTVPTSGSTGGDTSATYSGIVITGAGGNGGTYLFPNSGGPGGAYSATGTTATGANGGKGGSTNVIAYASGGGGSTGTADASGSNPTTPNDVSGLSAAITQAGGTYGNTYGLGAGGNNTTGNPGGLGAGGSGAGSSGSYAGGAGGAGFIVIQINGTTSTILTSGTSYTIPSAVRSMKIWVIGAGGGGTGTNVAVNNYFAGGGSGGICYYTWNA